MITRSLRFTVLAASEEFLMEEDHQTLKLLTPLFVTMFKRELNSLQNFFQHRAVSLYCIPGEKEDKAFQLKMYVLKIKVGE